jgi:hypothetical protein
MSSMMWATRCSPSCTSGADPREAECSSWVRLAISGRSATARERGWTCIPIRASLHAVTTAAVPNRDPEIESVFADGPEPGSVMGLAAVGELARVV